MTVDETHAVVQELRHLYAWIKRGEYVRNDAPDEIARAIDNRIWTLEHPPEMYKGSV